MRNNIFYVKKIYIKLKRRNFLTCNFFNILIKQHLKKKRRVKKDIYYNFFFLSF